MGSPQPKKASRKIESLDWRTMAQSSALKGMTSFLDVTPEEARGGNYPDGLQEFTRTPLDSMSPGTTVAAPDNLSSGVGLAPPVILSSPDRLTPIIIQSPMDRVSPLDSLTSDDRLTPPDGLSSDDSMSPDDNYSSPDIQSPMYNVSPDDTLTPPDRLSPPDVVTTWSKRRSQNVAAGNVPTRNRRIIPCRLAQDGHTISEELVYKVLWDKTTPENRTVRMGYSEISTKTRLSARTIFRMIPILKQKLSIDVIEEHRSGDLIPKLYRVYSYKEILDRRRARGMEYVIRGTSVTFVTAEGEAINLDKRREVPPATLSGHDRLAPPDRLSSDDFQSVAESLNRFWTVDEAAVQKLIQDCRSIRPDATTDEILYFVDEKVTLVRSTRTIHSPTGFVLSTVPQCFAGKTFEIFRARRAETLRLAAEEEERKGREAAALDEWVRKTAEATLANPKASESAKKEAERTLRSFSEK